MMSRSRMLGALLVLLTAGCGSAASPSSAPPSAASQAPASPAASAASAKPAASAAAPAASAQASAKPAASAAAATGTLADIKKRGSTNVYMEAQFEPYESVDKDGKIIGLDVDLTRKMFEEDMSGVSVKFIDLEYAGLLPSLIDGKADFLISGLGSTKERVQRFDFSSPYSPTVTVAVIRDNDNSIKSTDDLNGKVVGAQTGTPTLTNAQNFSKALKDKGQPGFKEIKDYPHFPEELADLTAQRLDAVSMSLATISLAIKNRPGQYKVLGPIGPINYFAVVTRKGDTALMDYINSEIKKFKADSSLATLHKKWFGDSYSVDVSTLPDRWEPLS